MNQTEIEILRTLREHREITSTNELMRRINARNKHYVFTCAMLLHRMDLIEMQIDPRGGPTIYRIRPELMQVRR